MALTKNEFAQYIRQFQFRELFNDMGWNNDRTSQPIVVDNITFQLQAVAEKSGFKILLCPPDDHGKIPDYSLRKKIETKVTKLFQEHLIIFYDAKKQEQVWQLVVRQSGKPAKVTETRYHIAHDPELLYQRTSGLFFELDEEERITIVDVTGRVAANFQQNTEKVTKQFYDKFKKEHTSFLGFIKGIDEQINKDWYASLMLNRLMFCYFIQKKGFLDNNKNYLRDKLKSCQDKKGKDQFYSFYRSFLLALFHQGLGAPDHSKELKDEIGKIPYLNGGLFDEHELEKSYNRIDIDDKAFEHIFDFFDQYEWHLDTRITATGKDINPDVIGYIFEKYINDRAQMGAYYTKEDITEYISKNCVLPYLFDETKRQYPKAFATDGEIWQMVKGSGDAYIYDAVKYGINPDDIWGDLPDDVKAGLDPNQPDLVEKRKCWNKPAPSDIALPTEIYREVIHRRKRYDEVRQKIENGELTSINDFITYNLNIRQLAQDVIENTNDHDFLKTFYKALINITILDPTCGSGAFLFAAMNILESLYEACIQRMVNFVSEALKGKYKFFEDTLAQVKAPEHPNLQYFIYKSIILRNLYGVDIMNEAVEIAKLRLFLKLVATVEVDYRKPNLGLEPLPDIDFNIRAGNTLIGFATEKELEKSFVGTFDFDNSKGKLLEKCDVVARAFARYKEIQLGHGDDYKEFRKAKEELNKRLKELQHVLNIRLSKQYGIDAIKPKDFADWLSSYMPFHWFAEYYEIIHDRGGFDVIIGNPPYVEYSKIRKYYTVPDHFITFKCGNLYPFILELANKILSKNGHQGFIVPLSAFCTKRMEPLVQLYRNLPNYTWISHFGWRPSTLFEGVNIPLSILISTPNLVKLSSDIQITEYYKWYQDKRPHLFDLIDYNFGNELLLHDFVMPKIGKQYGSIINKLLAIKNNINRYTTIKSGQLLYYRNTGGLYWRIIINFKPYFKLNGKEATSSTLNTIAFKDEESLLLSLALLNSNLFWLYYVAYSSFHHVNPIDLISFPVDFEKMPTELKTSLISLAKELMQDMNNESSIETRIHKGGNNSQSQTFYPSRSKAIVDRIDVKLAKHYQFDADELDRIINYDIMFRLQNGDENDA